MTVEEKPKKVAVRCECPEHECRNIVDESEHEVVLRPAVCTPCLYGCLP